MSGLSKALSLVHAWDASEYYVAGGVALDALRGETTRQHAHVDVMLASIAIDPFAQYAEENGYEVTPTGSLLTAVKEQGVVRIWPLLQIVDDYVSVRDTKSVHYPREAFMRTNFKRAEGLLLRLAPNEVLAYDGQFSKYAQDKGFAINLPVDKTLYEKIFTVDI
jgi:hypothetical protein